MSESPNSIERPISPDLPIQIHVPSGEIWRTNDGAEEWKTFDGATTWKAYEK